MKCINLQQLIKLDILKSEKIEIEGGIYYLVVVLNFAILFFLLKTWTEGCFYKDLDTWCQGIELLKILGMSFCLLFGKSWIPILIKSYQIFKSDTKNRFFYSILICLMVTSIKYYHYLSMIKETNYDKYELRNRICSKLEFDNDPVMFRWKSEGRNLTIQEYKELGKIIYLPNIPDESKHINYEHSEGPPDYGIKIEYTLSLESQIEEFEINGERGLRKKQKVRLNGESKIVIYEEVKI